MHILYTHPLMFAAICVCVCCVPPQRTCFCARSRDARYVVYQCATECRQSVDRMSACLPPTRAAQPHADYGCMGYCYSFVSVGCVHECVCHHYNMYIARRVSRDAGLCVCVCAKVGLESALSLGTCSVCRLVFSGDIYARWLRVATRRGGMEGRMSQARVRLAPRHEHKCVRWADVAYA